MGLFKYRTRLERNQSTIELDVTDSDLLKKSEENCTYQRKVLHLKHEV